MVKMHSNIFWKCVRLPGRMIIIIIMTGQIERNMEFEIDVICIHNYSSTDGHDIYFFAEVFGFEVPTNRLQKVNVPPHTRIIVGCRYSSYVKTYL